MSYASVTASTNGITVHFRIAGSSWAETLHDVPETAIIDCLNTNFKTLTGRLVPTFGAFTENKERFLYYEGRTLEPDTLVRNLLKPGQNEIQLYFVWEDKVQMTDEEHANAFFEERDFDDAGEEFLHELDMYYEDQLYTAQDHMTDDVMPKMVPQAALITIPPPPPIELPLLPPTNMLYTPAFSMCIPRVFPNITDHRIRAIFFNLGYPEIEEIDFVKTMGRNKRTGQSENYNRVFIHFKPMNVAEQRYAVELSLRKLFNGEQVKIMYDSPWFWMVSMSRSNRQMRRPIIPEIIMEELNDLHQSWTGRNGRNS